MKMRHLVFVVFLWVSFQIPLTATVSIVTKNKETQTIAKRKKVKTKSKGLIAFRKPPQQKSAKGKSNQNRK